MKRFGLFLVVVATIILGCHGQAAQAQCVGHSQASLTGSWQVYVSHDSTSGLSWTRMQVIVGTTGAVQAGTVAVDAFGHTATVTGGSLILNVLNCTVTGTILVRPAGAAVSTKIRVKHATLSLDDQSIAGVGTISGAQFTFTGVKINTL